MTLRKALKQGQFYLRMSVHSSTSTKPCSTTPLLIMSDEDRYLALVYVNSRHDLMRDVGHKLCGGYGQDRQ